METTMHQPKSREELIEIINRLKEYGVNDIDISQVDYLGWLFFQKDFNGYINDWDTSNVVDMAYMFNSAKKFNQPLNNWDVSSVTNMECMFCNATSFNQSLNDWDVSKVEDMRGMFGVALSFNRPLNKWNVSNVGDMRYMFKGAIKFNQNLNDWDVSRIGYGTFKSGIREMFCDAVNYTYSMRDWYIEIECETDNFLKNAIMWFKNNTQDDMPMVGGARLEIIDNFKRLWM